MNQNRQANGWASAALAVMFLAGSGVSQTDDDGVLPGQVAGGPGAGGSGGAQNAVADDIVLTMAGYEDPLAVESTDERLASLTFTADQGVVGPQDGSEGTEPTVLHGAGFEPTRYVEEDSGSVVVQGHVTATLPDGLEVTMTAAPVAMARAVVLLFHTYDLGVYGAPIVTDTLGEVLDGSAPASGAIVLGDLAEVDVLAFQRLVAKHAADMPGFVVTWAFLSVDTDGVPHASAVRASTAGDLLEAATW